MSQFWIFVGVAFSIWFLLVVLFTPRIDYHISTPLRSQSDEFLHVIQSICQTSVHRGNRVEILTDGSQFYPQCSTPSAPHTPQ